MIEGLDRGLLQLSRNCYAGKSAADKQIQTRDLEQAPKPTLPEANEPPPHHSHTLANAAQKASLGRVTCGCDCRPVAF